MITNRKQLIEQGEARYSELPEALQKSVDFAKKASGQTSDTIDRVIAAAILKMNEYLSKEKKPAKKNDQRIFVVKPGAHHKETTPRHTKPEKQNSHKKELKKAIEKIEAGHQVERLPDEIVIIKRFIGFQDKTKEQKQVMSLLDFVQKAIVEKRIRKTSAWAKEIADIQRMLMDLYRSNQKSNTPHIVKIEAKKYDHLYAIAHDYSPLKSIALIKRYINLDGPKQTVEKAEKLLKDVEKFIAAHPADPYLKALKVLDYELGVYIYAKGKVPLHIEAQQLNGAFAMMAVKGAVAAGKGIARGVKKVAEFAAPRINKGFDKGKELLKKGISKLKPHVIPVAKKVAKHVHKKVTKKKQSLAAPGKKSVSTERCYIDFLNKDKKFAKDRKYFNSYEAAVKWGKKQFERWDPDMVHYESLGSVKTKPEVKPQPVKPAKLPVANHEYEFLQEPGTKIRYIQKTPAGKFLFKDMAGAQILLTEDQLNDALGEATEIKENLSGAGDNLFNAMDKTKSGPTFMLSGDIGRLLGNMERYELAISVEGDQGSGKTQLAFQLADAFADKGDKVGIFELEMSANSAPVKTLKDTHIKPENQSKILITDKAPKGVDTVSEYAEKFDVIIIDSWGKLEASSKLFDSLRRAYPNTIFIVLFQRTAAKVIRGGTAPLYDAGINIVVNKFDDGFVNNWATTTKNRYGESGLKYNIYRKKLIKYPGIIEE